jgi:O-antigen/teichoic acid export membrane protein
VIASVVVVAGLVLFAEPLAAQFADAAGDEPLFVRLFRIGAPYIPLFALLQVLRYCTQAYKTMTPSVISGNIVQPVVRFIVGLIVLLAGFEVAGLVHTLNISIAAAGVVAAYYFVRMMTEEERAARPRAPVGPMVRFAMPQGGASLLGIQSLGLGVLVVGKYASDVQVAIFALALSLQGPGTVFLGGILNIWAPVVSDLHAKGEIDRLDRLYKVITRWVATFSFPVWAALIVMPYVFVDLFVPARGSGIATVVAILAAGNFFYTGTGPTGYVLSMTGRPGANLINSVVSVALYVVAGAWAVPRYGAEGMAVVDAIVTAVVNTARVIQAKVLVGVQPFGKPILKPMAATAIGAVVLLLWRWIPGYSVWFDASGIVVAGLVYVAALRAFGMDPEEREVWERIKKRAKRKKKRS